MRRGLEGTIHGLERNGGFTLEFLGGGLVKATSGERTATAYGIEKAVEMVITRDPLTAALPYADTPSEEAENETD